VTAPALRLDRLLANLGYGSRREVIPMIRGGRVSVDGTRVADPSTKARAADVRLDSVALDHPDGVLVMLNKPVGVVCSHEPEEGTRAYDLVPPHWEYRNPRVETVGRLDKDTSGLLVLTDDHQLLHRLTSPKHHVVKRYEVTLASPYDETMGVALTSGTLVIEGDAKPCLPAEIEVLSALSIALSITEGRYHQVRRMVAACGNHVEALHRTHFGPWSLGDCAEGGWVDVTYP
jgi:16S rRNA pseudouridine516 synthase